MPSDSHISACGIAPWLRFASQRLVGTLNLRVNCIPMPKKVAQVQDEWDSEEEEEETDQEEKEEVELPVCERATGMTLFLGDQWRSCLKPATGSFAALTDLVIEETIMEARALEALVSVQCPRLKNLNLCISLVAASDVSLRSDSLMSLSFHAGKTRRLEVVAPILEELDICRDIEAHTISAPKLAEFFLDGARAVYYPCCHDQLVDTERRLRLLDVGEDTSPSVLKMFDKVDELELVINAYRRQGRPLRSLKTSNITLDLLEEVEIEWTSGSFQEIGSFVKYLSKCSATLLEKVVINCTSPNTTPPTKKACEGLNRICSPNFIVEFNVTNSSVEEFSFNNVRAVYSPCHNVQLVHTERHLRLLEVRSGASPSILQMFDKVDELRLDVSVYRRQGYRCPPSCCGCGLPRGMETRGIILDSLQEVEIEWCSGSFEEIKSFVEHLCKCSVTLLGKVIISCTSRGAPAPTKEACDELNSMCSPHFIVEFNVTNSSVRKDEDEREEEEEEEEKEEVELPVCEKAKEMTLFFGDLQCRSCLRPAAGSFAALTDLVIQKTRMEARALESLVSTQCPRLKNLTLDITLLAASDVSLHSQSLIFLFYDVQRTSRLEVIMPRVEELDIRCDIEAHTISAPKLEEIKMNGFRRVYYPCRHDQIVDLEHRRLRLLEVSGEIPLSFLKMFDKVDELRLNISIYMRQLQETKQNFVDETDKLPRCETLHITWSKLHGFAPTMLHLLRKCNGIRKLTVEYCQPSSGMVISLSICSLSTLSSVIVLHQFVAVAYQGAWRLATLLSVHLKW
ncbi:hypothetical protein EJB05_11872 [Eragrostis curvula]|uniref:F-box/LRR-repeat protein 15/At3g58940/PEG3-like LRR domain-containing protein n=1 Tax=Eragrostis curvula TaxID=38414 RepID=A0A5J9VQL3_9POAL|nr:hypothetical protein EJB05_11872 [Eragrostis curvula]